MRIVERRKSIATLAALLAALAPAAQAHGCVDEGTAIALAVLAPFLPSETGVAVATANPSPAAFVIGWSGQLPVGIFSDAGSMRHRIVGGVDLLLDSGGASGRARLGYRYGRRHFFVGAGAGVAGAGLDLSPEIGLKFAHSGNGGDHEIDPSLHLLARAEIAPESGHVRGATVLFGWNVF